MPERGHGKQAGYTDGIRDENNGFEIVRAVAARRMAAQTHVREITPHQFIPYGQPGCGQDLGACSDLITVLGHEGTGILRDIGSPADGAGDVRNCGDGDVRGADAAAIEIEHQPESAQKGEHAAIRVSQSAGDDQGLAEQNRETKVPFAPMKIGGKRAGLKSEGHRIGAADADVALVDIVARHQGHEQQGAHIIPGQAAEKQRPGQQAQEPAENRQGAHGCQAEAEEPVPNGLRHGVDRHDPVSVAIDVLESCLHIAGRAHVSPECQGPGRRAMPAFVNPGP